MVFISGVSNAFNGVDEKKAEISIDEMIDSFEMVEISEEAKEAVKAKTQQIFNSLSPEMATIFSNPLEVRAEIRRQYHDEPGEVFLDLMEDTIAELFSDPFAKKVKVVEEVKEPVETLQNSYIQLAGQLDKIFSESLAKQLEQELAETSQELFTKLGEQWIGSQISEKNAGSQEKLNQVDGEMFSGSWLDSIQGKDSQQELSQLDKDIAEILPDPFAIETPMATLAKVEERFASTIQGKVTYSYEQLSQVGTRNEEGYLVPFTQYQAAGSYQRRSPNLSKTHDLSDKYQEILPELIITKFVGQNSDLSKNLNAKIQEKDSEALRLAAILCQLGDDAHIPSSIKNTLMGSMQEKGTIEFQGLDSFTISGDQVVILDKNWTEVSRYHIERSVTVGMPNAEGSVECDINIVFGKIHPTSEA